jgi:hypothetical protein
MRGLVVAAAMSVALSAVISVAGGAARAQALKDADGPAEVPPASFTAPQYVDSKGCAYVRAGLGGKVSWIPRVTRDRKLMCGLQPSLGSAAVVAAAPAPATEAEAAPAPAAASAAAPSVPPAEPVVAAPTPAKPVAPKPKAVRTAQVKPVAGASTSPAALRRMKAADALGAVTLVRAEPVPGTATACPNTPQTAERYVLSDGRRLVRCGPPVRDPVAYLNGLGRPGLRVAGPGAKAAAPAGYVPVWQDDRLNPARGPQTAAGDAAMAAAYQQGVPMRIKPGTALKVPYSGSDGAFVQAGAFADPGNADRAVARLKAAGLPAARAKGMIGGRVVAFVLAGPVNRAQAAAALSAVRAAGFTDAFLR